MVPPFIVESKKTGMLGKEEIEVAYSFNFRKTLILWFNWSLMFEMLPINFMKWPSFGDVVVVKDLSWPRFGEMEI